jgi:CRP-like cAMP-binding protein
MPDTPLAVLKHIFPQLAPEPLAQLAAAVRCSDHPADVTLCHEGEVEHSLYVIMSGSVDVYKHLHGQRVLINTLGAGAHFGDLALLLDMPRTASIITTQPTRLLEIDRGTFLGLLRVQPEIVVAFSQLVLKRFLAQEKKRVLEIARLKRRETPPPKVFVSYARSDEAFTTRLVNHLLKQHIDAWLDIHRLEPGQSWARQIGEALDRCQVMLLVLSATSVLSENVEDEWNYYLDKKKPIVVVRREACNVPYRLSKLHYINFETGDYDDAVAQVVATLNTLL